MQDTFLTASNTLLENGFILGMEYSWKQEKFTYLNPYQVFIHPENHAVAVIYGTGKYRNISAKMYFTWKPNGPAELIDMYNFGYMIYHHDLKVFSKNYNDQNEFDISAVGFPRVQSSNFENVLEYYLLVLKNGTFIPWKTDSKFSLLIPFESEQFAYKLPPLDEKSYSEKELKAKISEWIIQERRRKEYMISKSRLRSILLNLGLLLDNFGLD
jgi:hypothetical protein